jgi:class 3 adenylate cyclase/tetratricopeptide (TPR) repeat protein
MQCPECSKINSDDSKFCNECGSKLKRSSESKKTKQKSNSQDGERKYATILFSDLSGYTAMTEKMDPEDVKILMENIFEKAGEIVEKYEGTVDSFFGDEILVLFGVPKVHEDDPLRAVHTAVEIHEMVDRLNLEFENKFHKKLSMHSGIETGLIITGDKFIGKGRQGLAGDTINLASRLTKLAKPGEIIIGTDTFKNTKHHFSFESRDPIAIKGKADPVPTFKLIDTKIRAKRTRRLHGVRAELIARGKELLEFGDAVKALKSGTGSVHCLYGFAGSGKSRLVEEFKATTTVKWFEGYTYPYTKNRPYFPIMTLFNHAMGISEEDSPETLKSKIEKSIGGLIKDSNDIIPYIGVLYSLNYPEIENVSPEFYKEKLFDAVLNVIIAISQVQPTIICIEDLHWADPSSHELIRFIHSKIDVPVLFLYITRPVIDIFSPSQIDQMTLEYNEIRINDLKPSDSKIMVQSLLKTKQIPKNLEAFIEKSQGNPFYLEEIINSLIESNVLIKNHERPEIEGPWELVRKISEADISSSIHGVITARVDRLETESKRILQEASVIGRSFYYEIINKVSETKKEIGTCLETLENLDLIKSLTSKTTEREETDIDLEYMFKHALTQEVVYNGLLKVDRKIIHEKIGLVIEQIFKDRLPEFYETLAHHFLAGNSTLKAVDYLIKSGDKNLKRYSLDEADDYFQKAFDLIDTLPEKTSQTNQIMIDLLTRWAMVFYYRGTFFELGKLLSSQEHLIDHMDDNEIKGIFIAWQGYSLEFNGKYLKAIDYLKKALNIGTKISSNKVIAYASTWLSWVCADMGLFDEGIEYGKRANKIAENLKPDHYIYFKSLAGIAWNYNFKGYAAPSIKTAEKVIQYGNQYSQVRSLSIGHALKGLGYIEFGDFSKAAAEAEQAVSCSKDPFYKFAFSLILIRSCIYANDALSTDEIIQQALAFFIKNNDKWMGDIAFFLNGVILIEKGKMSQGLAMMKKTEQEYIKQEQKGGLPLIRIGLGKIYLEIIKKSKPISIFNIIKNIGFIIQNVPSAYQKAIYWYSKSIEISEETGAVGTKAQALLDLGIIYRIKKQKDKAKQSLETAIELFEEVGAYSFLKRAKKELSLLNK